MKNIFYHNHERKIMEDRLRGAEAQLKLLSGVGVLQNDFNKMKVSELKTIIKLCKEVLGISI